ncbi:Fic family protein [Pseudolactococcus insecticola]|uniref:Fido domain-containing protein n=1 Tax=Pseudolactococcus insecticola TaxID=2709158 RepID=A0A6A0BAE6_9LACT|nr:Fic family protein [Lactococcus insecticola]GFH41431.1 hypothetical protein Hs20B_18290 [Lactococcus insecticola]
MDSNEKLAQFIVSLGGLNEYKSSVAQTKKALEVESTQPLIQNNNDAAIFQDAVKGINAIKQVGFSVDGIIAVNKQFDTPNEEQPTLPGHLRNAYYNEDDRIAVVTTTGSNQGYFPSEIITRQDLQDIVSEFENSDQSEKDAWRLFAKLSKLQPFQDGNKRTALIAANAAMGRLESQEYLFIPINAIDKLNFTAALMSFYVASSSEEEEKFLSRMLEVVPSAREVAHFVHQTENPTKDIKNIKTYKIKTEIREKNKNNTNQL